jgi:hypothetical protein
MQKDYIENWDGNSVLSIYPNGIVGNQSFENSEKEINRLNDFLEGTNKKLQTLESRRDQILSSRNNDIDQDLIRINPSTLEQEINTSELQKKEKQKSAGENQSILIFQKS